LVDFPLHRVGHQPASRSSTFTEPFKWWAIRQPSSVTYN
jgi:hypothetical protein